METPATMDFRLMSGEGDYGEYFGETNRIVVYTSPHSECMPNLLSTITHEVLHKIITEFVDPIDIEHEHNLIKRVMWFEQELIY